MSKDYALKGNIIYSNTDRQLLCAPNSYLIVNNNLCVDVYPCLPEKYQHLQVTDYQQAIIIPGFTDLHLHAPQYANIGLGMDLELLQWLEQLTFREEAKFADLHYADQAYQLFCHDLDQSATTRACIFGTIHRAATEILMEKLQGIGIKAYVGKVNMDSNCPHNLRESSPEQSARDTEAWITANESKFTNIRPILTPRFVPSCSPQLLTLLGELQRQYCLPLQSHLSENLSEVAWVKELYPQAASYADVYRHFGLLGDTVPTIMAHCVYLQQSEKQLLQERNVFIAHCPTSNTNLSSGAAPVGEYLERHIPLGLGSDVSG
ncbi:MAG: amidohydrolase family protein, partial [Clostridiales bacterium]